MVHFTHAWQLIATKYFQYLVQSVYTVSEVKGSSTCQIDYAQIPIPKRRFKYIRESLAGSFPPSRSSRYTSMIGNRCSLWPKAYALSVI